MHAEVASVIVVQTSTREAIMMDRRQTARARVIYSGVIAFNQRSSTMNCVVRNFSESGVKVEFRNSRLPPEEVDLVVPRKKRGVHARNGRRNEKQAGLAF